FRDKPDIDLTNPEQGFDEVRMNVLTVDGSSNTLHLGQRGRSPSRGNADLKPDDQSQPNGSSDSIRVPYSADALREMGVLVTNKSSLSSGEQTPAYERMQDKY